MKHQPKPTITEADRTFAESAWVHICRNCGHSISLHASDRHSPDGLLRCPTPTTTDGAVTDRPTNASPSGGKQLVTDAKDLLSYINRPHDINDSIAAWRRAISEPRHCLLGERGKAYTDGWRVGKSGNFMLSKLARDHPEEWGNGVAHALHAREIGRDIDWPDR